MAEAVTVSSTSIYSVPRRPNHGVFWVFTTDTHEHFHTYQSVGVFAGIATYRPVHTHILRYEQNSDQHCNIDGANVGNRRPCRALAEWKVRQALYGTLRERMWQNRLQVKYRRRRSSQVGPIDNTDVSRTSLSSPPSQPFALH